MLEQKANLFITIFYILVIIMSNTVTISKIALTPIKKYKKKNTFIPQDSYFYDVVSGIFPDKRKFEVVNFRDKKKNLVGRQIYFQDKNKNHNVINETIQNFVSLGTRMLDRFVYINNRLDQELHKIFYDKKKFLLETSVKIHSDADINKISLLQKGKKPVSMKYTQDWSGKAPELLYENTNGKTFKNNNTQYFPVWLYDGFATRFQELVRYIAKIQEKNHNMPSGIILEPQIVKHSSLNSTKHSRDEVFGVCNPFNGDIYISDKGATDGIGLLDTIAHEYMHAVDISDGMRLQSNAETINAYTKEEVDAIEKEFPGYIDFFRRSITRGIIKDDSEQGQMLLRLGDDIEKELTTKMSKKEHDKLEAEDRAIKKAKEEEKKIDNLIIDTFKFFESFVSGK